MSDNEYLDENGNEYQEEKPEQERGELKPCPFCGTLPQANAWIFRGISETRYFCPNQECPLSVRTVTLEEWNTRPIEDALNARIAELERRAARAKELLQDEMGDWLTVEAIYMPDHYLQLKQTIDVLDGGGE